MPAIALLTLAVVLAVLVLPPVPQPEQYHNFADQRAFLGIPHFLNVVSNVVFLLVGGTGLRRLLRDGTAFVHSRERWPYAVFFVSILLVGLGSGYYHLAPDNDRLFWDRLPMSLAFMSLLSAVLVERLGVRVGLRLFPGLAAVGPLSVLYWILTEQAGIGDLRFYGLVHFYPVLLIPLLLWLFLPRYTRGQDVLVVLALYGTALGSEWLDRQIFSLGGWVSGHTAKHVLAAMAAWRVWRMLRLRRALPWSHATRLRGGNRDLKE
jgi:hypothetical protein